MVPPRSIPRCTVAADPAPRDVIGSPHRKTLDGLGRMRFRRTRGSRPAGGDGCGFVVQ